MSEKGEVGVMTPLGDYSKLSTGQKILTDAYICEKIGTSLPKPLKTAFIDNADLVSEPIALAMEQIIMAYVTDGEMSFTE
jgi:hypothetical protein